ncbi:MAG: hypothetical protein JW821_11870 [Deltaproteobacteria bacterium]|nr:hypothetical protein [Deltaproteobacteria bacterium]
MIYEKERRYIIPFQDVPSPRAGMPEISVEERRGNFLEVETGFPEEVAVQEAKRCLSCRRCLGCALCWAECKPEAIDFAIPDEELDLEFDEVVLTRGQDNAFERLPRELGYGRFPDVITDLQFERMLSPTGPTDGLVVSPLDGEVPKRMAVIQGHPREPEERLLSSLVLGVNECILTLNRHKDMDVCLISPLCPSFAERFLAEAKAISALHMVEASPVSVDRGTENQGLVVKYSEGGKVEERIFDLVVVLTKPSLSPWLKSLGRKLDQPIL